MLRALRTFPSVGMGTGNKPGTVGMILNLYHADLFSGLCLPELAKIFALERLQLAYNACLHACDWLIFHCHRDNK